MAVGNEILASIATGIIVVGVLELTEAAFGREAAEIVALFGVVAAALALWLEGRR